jgi:hypothetical protein
LRAVFVEYHELLLGGAEGDPTQRQGTRDQGQKNESSAQDREAASSHRKDFRGRDQLPFLLQLPVKSPTIMRQYARHGANWQSIQLDAPHGAGAGSHASLSISQMRRPARERG